MESSKKFSAKEYFETQPPPPDLDEDVAKTRDFVLQQADAKRKVVLVTVCSILMGMN
jgi:phosphopantothenate---cysteine ligase (ATP)